MSFSNLEIALEDLPALRGVVRNELAERYASLSAAVTFACVFAPGAMLLGFALFRYAPFWGVAGIVAIWLASTAGATGYALRASRARNWSLREHDLIFRNGVFWRSETVQPLKRVQHVEVTRGPIEKRFELASLKVYGAGSGSATFAIPGLELEDAERLRDYLLDPTAAPDAHDE